MSKGICVWMGLVGLFLGGCMGLIPQGIAPDVAKDIPGDYTIQAENTLMYAAGEQMTQRENGIFVRGDRLAVDLRPDGCVDSDKILCICQTYKLCPLATSSGTAKVSLPQLSQQANNSVEVDVSAGNETLKLKGFMDGRMLQFTLGIRDNLRDKGIPALECIRVEDSYVSGKGMMSGSQFGGRFEGKIQITWSSGCKLGEHILDGALRLERRFVATKK